MSQASTVNAVEEVVAFFARGPSPEEIAAFRLSDAARERLRELLARNAAGELTQAEERELDQMVLLDDIVSLIRARAATRTPIYFRHLAAASRRMSVTRIPAALRRVVAVRAGGRCEYCGIQDEAVLSPHEADHVIAEQHGGKTDLANLAYSCFRCDRFKGPNVATVDPQNGAIVPIFNPRLDRWMAHFRLDGALIVPLTPTGRGTAALLHMNDERRVALRAELIEQGRFAPPQS